ncbi:MocR-like pyridoxine biosynthesis transcription factor PdxR [Pseudonocardia humida]|uniref:PLP-dependent aminotransferase family protein n=1 Tax=Pseudonocardia humida TaxID=2800819 RepID=A0ABT0ZS47_9PSEU|nr:PLP-dependent aminotransferase family protein [Pseudonocardia humida]MCO1653544.1 PLP-dependent aminotransferase family protein [Pseudonocardia humida]
MTGGTDFLQLDPRGVPRGGLTTWLTDALRSAAADGGLRVGDRLPSSRLLAADLGVSRGVVVAAYQRLVDEGVAVADGARGTVVAVSPHRSRPPAPPAAPAGPDFDLSPGVPDLSAFPRAAWLRAERAVLGSAGPADLGYGDPQGNPVLRAALARWLRRVRGVRAEAEDIVVVAGVAQAIALVAQVLRNRGADSLAVEDPGSRGAHDELAHWGLTPVPVPVDDEGLDVAALARTGESVVLVTPAHHFPTGVVLGPGRRRELLAPSTGIELVLEDDYDAEHRYDRAPVPALQAMAPDRVVHTGSVSKTLAPAMRLGWMIVPPRLRAEVVTQKYMSDLGNAALPQLVLAELMASGELERHLRRVRARQRRRRDAMLGALGEHLPGATVHGIAAGLHLLVTFPEHPGAARLDDVALAERARAAGVVVHPLSRHRQREGPAGLVLGYAAHPPDRIRAAIALLGRSLPG